MAIPFSFLALAFGLQLAIAGPAPPPRGPATLELVVAAIAIGTLYAINAWSFPVVAGLVALGALVRMRDAPDAARARAARWRGRSCCSLLARARGAAVPAHLRHGGRRLRHGLRARVVQRAGPATTAALYGLFAYLVVHRLRWSGSCARTTRGGRRAGRLAAALFAGSLLAAENLAGVVGAAWRSCCVAAHAAFVSRAPAIERYVWVLIGGGLLCLLIPELIYVKRLVRRRRALPHEHGLQARLPGVAAAGDRGRAGDRVELGLDRAGARGSSQLAWVLPLLALLALAAVYPVAGTYARKDGFADAPHLDGLRWLEESSPGDPAAIEWLNDNAPRGSVVLEAVGDDYSAFGHARISTFTGLPTVMGWVGHELQWGHDPGARRQDVEAALPRAPTRRSARPLLDRYDVRYVVVGPDRAHRPTATRACAKWDELGRRVFDRDGTTIWELR